GHHGRDLVLSEAERRVAGVSDYLLRAYEPLDSATMASGFSLYIGYYSQQSQGKTIHSPKNCLP
ncbi:MAG: exosortase-associated EpsI family protein, partial [Gemmatimonadales bacterium]|nr:exosortase-associated EpsI family protein [Gemmatimonadales bacterium]NIN48580.1 exosortase-associated EpsI family protein [Gemmatimonadales bacterium]NIP06044.1 exosortase-associated EpsI family protein [Gemmatimonadales bacterium]NIS64523.1 exosortase-associated EpsI family protein [Gemmatimonadales bacterium]